MANSSRSVSYLALIVVAGAFMRLSLASVNPPNNSYDNHLEPIALYSVEYKRPAPDECWQCYHPPVYPVLGAVVLEAVHTIAPDPRIAWEAVQWISAVASVGTMVLCMLLLKIFLPEDRFAQAGGLIFLIVLPRDLYTAASMGNDALLTLFVTSAVLCYARLQRHEPRLALFGSLGAFVVLAAWTKQSGLVALGLVLLIALKEWRARRVNRGWALAAVFLVIVLAGADEVWRTHQTGILFASNQHFEYRALLEGQPPGGLSASTFTTFLPIHLFEHPILHSSTVDSFWTQIFARTWFDYEPRFLPKNSTTTRLAWIIYTVGFSAMLVVIIGFIEIIQRGSESARTLVFVPLGFLAIAVLQTIRFPHFSSMKALFLMPSISVFVLAFGYGAHAIRQRKWGRRLMIGLLAALAVIGSIHWISALSLNSEALNAPTSPLWPFPDLGHL